VAGNGDRDSNEGRFVKLSLAVLLCAVPLSGQAAPGYRVGVVSESGDMVSWLRPTPEGGLVLERTVATDPRPPERDGPHNITVSPDHTSYYVSVAHGTPHGMLWRFDATTHRLLGMAEARGYPTTIGLTPDGEMAFVANSDFFGDRPAINPVTVVHTPTMTTITHVAACDMPHGVKVDPAGNIAWVSCMHSDELLAIEVATLTIGARIRLGAGNPSTSHAGHGPPLGGASTPPSGRSCSATFVSISADGSRLFVACNAAGTVQVWRSADRTLEREIPVGAGAYNVEPSPDGRWLVVTNKKAQSISVIDATEWKEVARLATSRPVVHGVAWSPDSRYVYISQESIGAEAGAVDVFDMSSRTRSGSIAVPGQPTGITILRTP
jgi:DNA-binding beta-propeller fold protein YncE